MRNIKWILSSILFFASLLTEFLLSSILASVDKTVSINVGTLVAISLLFLAISLWCLFTLMEKKNKAKNQIKELHEQSKREHDYYENIIKDLHKNLEELYKTQNENYDEPGNLLFLLALSQDNYEPLKIQLLKKAAFEHKNVFAAVILAGIYKSGLIHNNITIVDKNHDAALELYEAVNSVDPYGITDWLIGYT